MIGARRSSSLFGLYVGRPNIGRLSASLLIFVLAIPSVSHHVSCSPEDHSPAPGTSQSPDAPQTFRGKTFNLVFVSVTNLRADHLGTFGYSRDTSPNIDRLAEQSIVFEDAFSHASWTLPVAISIFSSQYPFTHGLMNRNVFEPLPPEVPTLVDILKAAGYATAAFVGDRDYATRFGLVSRFDKVHDHVNDETLLDWKKYGVLGNTVPDAITWLRANKDRKFFILLQGYDAHCPFEIPQENAMFDPDYEGYIDFTKCYWTFRRTAPVKIASESGAEDEIFLLKTTPRGSEELEEMFGADDVHHMIALYDGEIRNSDRLVGAFLDELKRLGLERETIVVFFSEHGDMFGKHGRFMRGGPLRGTFYDDVLHVPLIVKHPELAARRVKGLVQLIDMAPTVLDMLGLEVPPTFQGRTLRPLILEERPVNQYVFAGSAYTPARRNPFFRHSSIVVSVRTLRWKMIFERIFSRDSAEDYFELFDLEADPEELTSVLDTNPQIHEKLNRACSDWLLRIGADTTLSMLQKQPETE